MRKILYAIILALLAMAPVKRLDVAKLEPVQTVAVFLDQNEVILQTDTDNKGRGETVEVALQTLEDTTPGVIYLDTAQYLLVTEEAVICVKELRKYLSPSVKVVLWDGEGSVASASQYLDVRKDLPRLKDWSEKSFEKN